MRLVALFFLAALTGCATQSHPTKEEFGAGNAGLTEAIRTKLQQPDRTKSLLMISVEPSDKSVAYVWYRYDSTQISALLSDPYGMCNLDANCILPESATKLVLLDTVSRQLQPIAVEERAILSAANMVVASGGEKVLFARSKLQDESVPTPWRWEGVIFAADFVVDNEVVCWTNRYNSNCADRQNFGRIAVIRNGEQLPFRKFDEDSLAWAQSVVENTKAGHASLFLEKRIVTIGRPVRLELVSVSDFEDGSVCGGIVDGQILEERCIPTTALVTSEIVVPPRSNSALRTAVETPFILVGTAAIMSLFAISAATSEDGN